MKSLAMVAREVRIDIARMFFMSGTGHFAPAMSCVDILVSLYFGGIIDWGHRFSERRDRVVLSKGHGCAALYAVLARAGYFPKEELLTFYKKNSRLGGHPNIVLPGIETATGALGHGICFATGTAMAAKMDEAEYRTYVVLGDGESEEGSVWEAAEFASNQKLDNLTAIMDRNRLQASAWVDDIASIEPVEEKWGAFGWHVIVVNGHDYDELHAAFIEAKKTKEAPTLIIANTVKGKGCSIAENTPDWHSRAPKGEEWNEVCKDLGITMEELDTI